MRAAVLVGRAGIDPSIYLAERNPRIRAIYLAVADIRDEQDAEMWKQMNGG